MEQTAEDFIQGEEWAQPQPAGGSGSAPLATDPLAAALQQVAQNQALLTNLLAERETVGGALGGGSASSSSNDPGSLRGPALMMRRRRQFFQEPLHPWDALNERLQEKMHVSSPTQLWSAEQYGRELVPWHTHKLARRSFFLLARMHAALRQDDVKLTKGLVAQGLKYFEKIAVDHGSQEAALLLLPWEDPPASEAQAPPTHLQDPFSGLLEAEEAALGMKYLTDMHAFNIVRAERAKGLGKGKKGDKNEANELQDGSQQPRKKK